MRRSLRSKESRTLSVSSAAAIAGVDVAVIELMTSRGVLPHSMTRGGHRRYSKAEVYARKGLAKEIAMVERARADVADRRERLLRAAASEAA